MINTQATNGVAVGALTSPLWMQWLSQVNEFAALVTPILGATWLLIQIIGYFRNRKKK